VFFDKTGYGVLEIILILQQNNTFEDNGCIVVKKHNKYLYFEYNKKSPFKFNLLQPVFKILQLFNI
jgi:hypothetical protein